MNGAAFERRLSLISNVARLGPAYKCLSCQLFSSLFYEALMLRAPDAHMHMQVSWRSRFWLVRLLRILQHVPKNHQADLGECAEGECVWTPAVKWKSCSSRAPAAHAVNDLIEGESANIVNLEQGRRFRAQ